MYKAEMINFSVLKKLTNLVSFPKLVNFTNLSPVPTYQNKSTSLTLSMQTLPNNYAFYIYLHYKYSQFQQNLNILYSQTSQLFKTEFILQI